MKKHISTLFAFILWLSVAHAAPPVIHLQKGDKHIALFGTIHLTKPDYFPLPAEVTNALAQSDILAVELDMTAPETLQTVMTSMATLSAKPGETVKDLLSEEAYQRFKTLAGENAERLERFPPWLVAETLSLSRAEQLGFVDKSVDEALIHAAKSQKISVYALETVDEQLGVFDSVPIDEEKQILQTAIGDDFFEEMKRVQAIWENADAAAIDALLQKTQETPYLYQRLLSERNKAMAKRIIALTQDNNRVFVAIGALHLYGKDSVVQLLLDAGYREK